MKTQNNETETAAAAPEAPDQVEKREWRAIRKKAGRKINPETAEVMWDYRQTLDPYGIHGELPDELSQVGREYFARSPGSDIWVLFDDLPRTTRDALWTKHGHKLAFPAGLPLSWLAKSKSGNPVT